MVHQTSFPCEWNRSRWVWVRGSDILVGNWSYASIYRDRLDLPRIGNSGFLCQQYMRVVAQGSECSHQEPAEW